MIFNSIQKSSLPRGINKALKVLLYKGHLANILLNYRPITLLNIFYKILAKALQKKFQLFLLNLINEYQIAFILMKHILDNILLQTEMIEWCK